MARFQVWENQGRYEVSDAAKDGYIVAHTPDGAAAEKLAAELNRLAESCQEIGIDILTRDDA